jgi:hypothetical protein
MISVELPENWGANCPTTFLKFRGATNEYLQNYIFSFFYLSTQSHVCPLIPLQRDSVSFADSDTKESASFCESG